ncbi:hypothetical protein E5K00_14370 [Hymenobacter aquaticus]|uniref:Uncharacterized protein n=1 Tax=Hymenobacter aquaticus TaxID=1867101 RepID=A0A4Z0PUR3_9BACT|nr:hypothetical protein [Hymenobacter aquaticus]TGE21467.1 hypothetical protein E5K00_14370 [Hymenobacter aquaticus]
MASPFKNRFKNFFLSKSISRESMKKLVADHLDALEAAQQPAGAPDTAAMAARLRPLFEQFQVGLGSSAASQAQRGTHTGSVADTLEALRNYPAEIARVHILPKHDDKSATYREFFPQGRTAFTTASQKTIGTLVRAFAETADKYAAVVPVAAVAELQKRLKNFEEASTRQGKVVKVTKDGSQAIGKDQRALGVLLFAHYGALVSAFAETPAQAEPYFDFSVLPASQRKKSKKTADAPGK